MIGVVDWLFRNIVSRACVFATFELAEQAIVRSIRQQKSRSRPRKHECDRLCLISVETAERRGPVYVKIVAEAKFFSVIMDRIAMPLT